MSVLQFDFVIIGAGVIGSWTAKELVKYGKVLLLEQFTEPHTRGSSQGQSRLICSGLSEPYYADMMPHAFKMWKELEVETNQKLIVTTGALVRADSPNNLFDCINNMKRICPENLVELTSSDIKAKYPSILKFDENYGFVFDKSGAIVFAHKAVRAIQQWFQNSGGLMWDNCKVTEITPKEDKVLIKTSKSDVIAKSLIITTGAWTKQLLSNLVPDLPLEPKAVKVYYWKEKEKGVYSALTGFPAISYEGPPWSGYYSLPSLEYPGLMKVCLHDAVPCDPDERDKAIFKDPVHIRKYIEKHYPLLETDPAIIETCIFTCTPDGLYLIDRLPEHKNILIGTGFSGCGFKTSPTVGRLLSELARGVEPFLDVKLYSLSRFSKV